MRVIHLARKPLGESSVAANTLEHGTGALNIDACRIRTEDNLNGGVYAQNPSARHDGTENWRYKRGEVGEFQQPVGRWPSNVIFQHLDGCRRAGVREVLNPSGPASGPSLTGVSVSNSRGQFNGVPSTAYPGKVETIEAWNCEPGCPVADLDVQVGDRPSTWTHSREHRHSDAKPESKFRPGQPQEMPQGPLYADKGGVSRFFKQVGGSHLPTNE